MIYLSIGHDPETLTLSGFFMKRITVLVMITLITLSFAQTSYFLTGYVTNEIDEPVEYAIVNYPEKNITVTTDEVGFFALPVKINSNDQLVVQRIGFADQTITVGSSKTIHITLLKEPVKMNTVSVSAKPISGSLMNNEYTNNNSNSIQLLAQQIPAVQIRSTGSLAGNRSFSFNGGPSNHTKVFFDDVDLTSSQNGVSDLSQIPTALISTITVSPLPSVFYGSGAVDGVFTLNTNSHQSALHATIGGYGFESIHAETSLPLSQWKLNVSIGTTKEDGNFSYSSGDSTVKMQNNYFDQNWLFGSLKGSINNQLFLSYFNLLSIQGRGISGSLSFPSPTASKQDTLNIQSLSIGIPFDYGHAKLGFTRRRSGEFYKDENPWWPIQSHHALISDQTRFNLTTTLTSDLYAQSLAELKKEYIKSSEVGNHSRTIFSTSVRLNWSLLNTFHIIPAVRYDHLKDKYNEYTNDIRISMNVLKTGKLSVATGTASQYPGFNDLYYRDSGNPHLKPERSNYSSVEYKQHLNQFGYLSISYMSRNSQDLIQWQPTDSLEDAWEPINIAKTLRKTFTFSGEYHFQRSPIDFNWHFSLLDPIDKTTNKPLIYCPDKIGMVGIKYSRKFFRTWGQVHYTGAHHYTVTEYNSDWVAVVKDKVLDGFYKISIGAEYDIMIRERSLSLNFSVNNLLDEDVRTFADYPEPGRVIKAGISYRIN